ncbi:substrate-binding periplasmic protein [Pseudomonas sp. NPDC007930]|uniref:substrate-binding periplasmic protein n=1 Tax=Pseudomonas sp. NPDC007930 TaxID=3364417 RepID=UPI0036E74075
MSRRWLALCLAAPLLFGAQVRAAAVEAVTEESSYTYYLQGELAGPLTYLTQALLARAKLDYAISVYPWARAYDMALAEPNVLIFPILRTAEREARFKWVGEFAQIHSVLYRRSDRQQVQLGRWQDAQRYTVGVVRDDFREVFLRGQGFTRLVVSASPQESVRKLLNGQVDLIPLAESDAERFSQLLGPGEAPLTPVRTIDEITAHAWYAYSLNTPDAVVERTRKALQGLQAEGAVGRLMMGGR